MSEIGRAHGYVIGLGVIGVWGVIMFWSLALRFTRYDETPTFWRAVSVGQVLLALQFLVGLVLLGWWLIGNGPAPGARTSAVDGRPVFNGVFHVLYGVGFPLLALGIGHRLARERRYDPHLVFAVVGLVIFGLTARAFMVGAGVGA
jgi:hypothetical protein